MKIRVLTKLFKFLRYHRLGFCNICGKPTVFLCSDHRWTDRSMICMFCRSKSRQRLVAASLLDYEGSSQPSLKRMSGISRLRILNIDTHDVISRYLMPCEYFVNSGYFPERGFGNRIGPKTYSQNLEALTFSDEAFDVVITEHVFEHVRDFRRGFKEIFRVLDKGGVHLFTIPFQFDRNTTVRVDTSGPDDVLLLPPEFHGDHHNPDGRILAYRKFGVDLFAELDRIGFETSLRFSSYRNFIKHGILGSCVFVSRKPGS